MPSKDKFELFKDELFFDKNSPYQFYLPLGLKQKGIKKAKINNISLAPFMKMAWEQFLERPIEVSMRLLRQHQKRKSRSSKVQIVRKPIKLKGAKVRK